MAVAGCSTGTRKPPTTLTNNFIPREENDSDQDLMKRYSCLVDIDYPETKEDERQILARIETIMEGIRQSNGDLDFIKDIVIEENSEEIILMDFIDFSCLELKTLPWQSIKFEAESLTRGSTILNFNLTFKELPRNPDDIMMYRIMELIILSAIENIQFVKSIERMDVEAESTDDNHLILSARVKSHTENVDDALVNRILQKLRATVKYISGYTDESSSAVTEEMIDKLLETILEKEGNTDVADLKLLNPVDMRKMLRKAVEESKIAEKDMAAVTFELDTTTKKKKSKGQKMPKSTNWLFPFDCRKLSDLPEDIFHQISVHLTKDLPPEEEIWYKEFIPNFLGSNPSDFSLSDMIELQGKVSRKFPYPEILLAYKDRGGTFGGLLKALDKFIKSVPKHKKEIKKYKAEVENIRTKMFEDILESVYYPSPIPGVQTMLEFDLMFSKFKLKLKNMEMRKFEDVRNSLTPGDQLWIFHQRPLMRSYAHVMIIIEDQKFIHVSSPEVKLQIRARALICEDSQDNLDNDDLCFVVQPNPEDKKTPEYYTQRAKACLGIHFDYDADLANCETFCHGVHGIWDNNIQV